MSDVVADTTDVLQRTSRGVVEIPVDVALAGDVRALVAAAHRHNQVGPRHVGPVEPVRLACRQVDPDLCHHPDDLAVNLLGRAASGRAGMKAGRGSSLEERLGHL